MNPEAELTELQARLDALNRDRETARQSGDMERYEHHTGQALALAYRIKRLQLARQKPAGH